MSDDDDPNYDPNDGYPPDDEARPPMPLPPATALPCERLSYLDVRFPGEEPPVDDDRGAEPEPVVVTIETVVVVRSGAVPVAIPEEGGGSGSGDRRRVGPGAGGGGPTSQTRVPAAAPPPPLPHAREQVGGEERGYALVKDMGDAIYGAVWAAAGVRRIRAHPTPDPAPGPGAVPARFGRGRRPPPPPPPRRPEWEATGEMYAVKEMPWQKIGRIRGRITEDPIAEVQAMQHFHRWHRERRDAEEEEGEGEGGGGGAGGGAVDVMMATNVVVPVDVLTDRGYLYTVTPYCAGGDLFEPVNEDRDAFTEAVARRSMRHILNGLESLRWAGLAHRDISLENLLVHGDSCVVIDMGQCALVPRTRLRRYLLDDRDSGCCKTRYRPPELWCREDYDGFSADAWCAAVVLFWMLAGEPPWGSAQRADPRFECGCQRGQLREMVESWIEEGWIESDRMSDEAVDLLHKCLGRRDPRERLSLRQMRDHPWMMGG